MRVPLDPKLKEKPITKKKRNTNFLTSGINCGHNKTFAIKKRRMTTSCSIANDYAVRRKRIHSYIVNTEKGYITKLPVQTNTSQQSQNRSQFDTRRLLELDTEVERNMRKFPTKFVPLSVVEVAPGRVDLLHGGNTSPGLEVAKYVFAARRRRCRSIPSDREELDLEILGYSTWNDLALFHEQMSHIGLRIIQDPFVHERQQSQGIIHGGEVQNLQVL